LHPKSGANLAADQSSHRIVVIVRTESRSVRRLINGWIIPEGLSTLITPDRDLLLRFAEPDSPQVFCIVATFISVFKLRHDLARENFALRQQLAVYHRRHPRPQPSLFDRLFWV
jgi:hypothetical protein